MSKLIIKAQSGLKSKYDPGGIKVKYQSAELAKALPRDYINPQPQMDWYAKWLDNRREQLEQNMIDTGLYPEQNIAQSLRNIFKGYQPGRISINKEIYRQLNNVANTIYEYDDNYNPELGPMDKGKYLGDPEERVVIRKGLNNKEEYSTILHELSHNANKPAEMSLGFYTKDSARSPQERKIKQIGVNSDEYYNSLKESTSPELHTMWNYENGYLNIPSEIYARMMQFRYENKLNPKKKYSINEIKNLVKKSKVDGINTYDIEKLTKALNEVAVNTSRDDQKLQVLKSLRNDVT